MSREEILEIDAHCRDNGVTRAAYLREIGVTQNIYYSSRRRWFGCDMVAQRATPTESIDADSTGGFLPIECSHALKPAPSKRSHPPRNQDQELTNVNTLLIEMRTPSGAELGIQGKINITMLKEIIQAWGGGSHDV